MKKLSLFLIVLLCISLFACQSPKDPEPTEAVAPSGEAVMPLPDDDGDGNPDVPAECAAVIYLSINPEVALFVDGSDRVITAEFLNEDAQKAYGDLKLAGLSYSECTGMIIEAAIEKQYLKADGEVKVEVSVLSEGTESAKISQAVEEKVQEVVAKEELKVTVYKEDVKEPGKIICWSCLGSGKCVFCETCAPCELCKGKGMLICEFCNEGYLDCDICHGNTSDVEFITEVVVEDVEYCSICGAKRGTEGVVCPTCKGTGKAPCHMCHGVGRLTCTQCGGRAYGENGEKCSNCDTNGLKDCNECEDGTEPCPVFCDHPGPFLVTRTEEVEKEVENPEFCRACYGQGRNICNVCHGDYAAPCELCSGTGVTPCGMCPTEKGVCEMCHGEGLIDP